MTEIYEDLVTELGIDPAEKWQPHPLPEFATHVIVPEQPELTEIQSAIETVQAAGHGTEGMANLLELVKEANEEETPSG